MRPHSIYKITLRHASLYYYSVKVLFSEYLCFQHKIPNCGKKSEQIAFVTIPDVGTMRLIFLFSLDPVPSLDSGRLPPPTPWLSGFSPEKHISLQIALSDYSGIFRIYFSQVAFLSMSYLHSQGADSTNFRINYYKLIIIFNKHTIKVCISCS